MNIERTSNIFDDISPDLDQRVFNGITPKPTIVKFIQNIFNKGFVSEFGVPSAGFTHLYLTGSLTTYQFSDSSDCDNSVFLNWEKFQAELGLNPKEARRRCIEMSITYLDGTFLPGGSHPLQFFIVPFGILPTDQFQKGIRSGWDYDTGRWLVPPEKDRVHKVDVEFPEVYARAAAIGDKLTTMLDAKDYDAALDYWVQIHKKRQLDQQNGGGDFSEGNIDLKYLLHTGIIDRMRNELNMSEYELDAYHPPHESATFSELPELQQEGVVNYLKEVAKMNTTPEYKDHIVQQLFELVGITDPTEQEQLWQPVKQEADGIQEERLKYYDEEGQRFRNEYEIRMRNMIEQYGKQALEILYKYADMAPGGLGEMDGDEETQVDHVVNNGNEWKFAYVQGKPPKVWGDGEVMSLNDGILPHTYVFYDDLNQQKMTPTSCLGWIKHDPLKDNNPHPWSVEVRGGEGLSNEEILQALKLPPDTKIERTGEGILGFSKVAETDHITMKVIYNFESDHIILGTQADAQDPGSIILGEYDGDKSVTLYHTDKQWLNANYFRRLWAFSFPKKPLEHVYFQEGQQDDQKLHMPTRPPRHVHHAMAERSGIPEVDALIEEFLHSPIGNWVTTDGTYELFRDPEMSHGTCQEVTKAFIEFAKSRGFKAYSTDTDLDELGYTPTGKGGEIGFNDQDEMQYGFYPEHTIATIVLNDPSHPYGREVYIDFTASQYGYTDHPKVMLSKTSNLNRILNEFKGYFVEHVSGRYGIEEMKDPVKAKGMCNYVAKEFVQVAKSEGLDAWLSNKGGTADDFGYTDRTIPGFDAHWWAIVREGSDTYGIDFTASQYGYEDFPVVKRWNGETWIS